MLKWLGIIVGGLLGIVVVAAVAAYVISEQKLNRTYAITPEAVPVPTDAAAIDRGRHIALTRGCLECHGENLAGAMLSEDAAFAVLAAPNLTAGTGGAGGTFQDVDWVRAIRHGVDPDGKSLMIMPSETYYHLNDADLGALISFIKSVPPVDNEQPARAVGPIARGLLAAGVLPLVAEQIDHDAPRPAAPEPGPTADYGAYLAVNCVGCHGENLAGGTPPEPGAMPAPNLTMGGNLGEWSEDDFVRALRSGTTPDGRQLSDDMPWKAFGQLSDDELRALWLYLQEVPAVGDPAQ